MGIKVHGNISKLAVLQSGNLSTDGMTHPQNMIKTNINLQTHFVEMPGLKDLKHLYN